MMFCQPSGIIVPPRRCSMATFNVYIDRVDKRCWVEVGDNKYVYIGTPELIDSLSEDQLRSLCISYVDQYHNPAPKRVH